MFEVGQTVWCVRRGKGTITCVDRPGEYPVRVEFGMGTATLYTENGKFHRSDINLSLFFSEPKIEGATEPPWQPKLKKGDQVVLKYKAETTNSVLKTSMVIAVEDETKDTITDSEGITWYKNLYSVLEVGKVIY